MIIGYMPLPHGYSEVLSGWYMIGAENSGRLTPKPAPPASAARKSARLEILTCRMDCLSTAENVCTVCMRCFNYCPPLAIHYMGMKNTRAKNKPPFQGPVPAFRPELIAKKK